MQIAENSVKPTVGPSRWRIPDGCVMQRGFTIVELITVIIILGIVAVAALPRFTGIDSFNEFAAADQVKAALRYAQKTAIAAHSNVTVTITTADPPACTTNMTGWAISCALPAGVALGGTLAPTFDSMGRPVPNATANTVVGGTTITIEAETGYVH
jgi:MSHA pilin protein MshC